MQESEAIGLLEETGALLSGHFELRSGLHSERFFQCANLLRFPDVASRFSDAVVSKMRAALGGDVGVDAVISPALGGILVGHEVARALGVMSIFAEKQDDMLAMRRFRIEQGARYVVAEDVVTRGGRVDETIQLVREGGGEVVAVVLFVDRSGGKAQFGIPTFSLLEMEPVVWDPSECPLCREGLPFDHPGS